MIALICDSCGKEHRGHEMQQTLIVPVPEWWTRLSITKRKEQIRLRACSTECASELDVNWPAWCEWRDLYGEKALELKIRFPRLPDPPRDPSPTQPDRVEPGDLT